uniref:Uncharacterized protein n=1 Tax=Anopheles maculatus TaxID=74869 RepID=A0A182T274_9DIPT
MSKAESEEEGFQGVGECSMNATLIDASQEAQLTTTTINETMIDGNEESQLTTTTMHATMIIKQQAQLVSKKAQRDAILRSIERIENFATQADGIMSEQAMSRIHRLEKCWEEFKMVANELRLLDDPCNADENDNILDEVDEHCLQIAVLIRAKTIKPPAPALEVKEIASGIHKNADEPSCHIKLPNLSLPVFNGNYDEWIPFRDIFFFFLGLTTS